MVIELKVSVCNTHQSLEASSTRGLFYLIVFFSKFWFSFSPTPISTIDPFLHHVIHSFPPLQLQAPLNHPNPRRQAPPPWAAGHHLASNLDDDTNHHNDSLIWVCNKGRV
ncbi:hypothetical protein KFK09_006863 [Dendrobium nobile]|uniref:Uncharacterized protein n=1 Tax=Dendrobium nobile TaxID=94219 RepID=A0A8T3BTL6_DENNO|nr:hypothetical protein KFK09_006863 [Dendrobium nobile]